MYKQVNTINDIVEVLRENPEALTELRSVMFPGDAGVPEEKLDELLQLVRRQEVAGARRDEAEARREEAEARREEAEIRRDEAIARMGDAIATLADSVEGLRGDFVSLGTDLGQLKGLGVESVLQGRVLQMIGNRLGMDEPVVLVSMQLPSRVDVGFKALVDEAASGDGPAISRSDQTRIVETDLIVQGRKDDTQVEAYLAVEASYTIEVKDITRVIDTRTALIKLFPEAEVTGAVFGVVVSDDNKRLARRNRIRVYETQLPT